MRPASFYVKIGAVINMNEPLAYRMRPKTLDEIIGQEHLIAKGSVLRRCAEEKKLFSMIFYGAPGMGKTTLATVLANEAGLPYRMFNAVNGTKKELDALFLEAKMFPGFVLIVDEVHRLNKDKQDLLLPHVENGNVTLIGATTANPLHSINPAIRSRCHLFEVKTLSEKDICLAIQRSLASPQGFHNEASMEEDAMLWIARQSGGDVRYALNVTELAVTLAEDKKVTLDLLKQIPTVANQRTYKGDDGHYDLVSAFQKSIRGSDADAALYYLALLIDSGDLESIERRLLVIAYEDIGLGNPAAVARTIQAIDAAKRIGFPEGRIPLSMAVIDLALSPKSRSAETAIDLAMKAVHQRACPIPDYLKFTPTALQEEDRYDYDLPQLWPLIQYLPDDLKNQSFYFPGNHGKYEKALAENYQKLRKIQRSNDLRKLKKKIQSMK